MFFRFPSLPAFIWGNTTSSPTALLNVTSPFHRDPHISLFLRRVGGGEEGRFRNCGEPERCLEVKRQIQYTIAVAF